VEELLDGWASGASLDFVQGDDADEELLVECTQALLEGKEPPVQATWEEIRAALEASEPLHATVEDAMSALRRRSWSKDA
jgi:hypothetical protein